MAVPGLCCASSEGTIGFGQIDTPTCGDKGPWAALTASKPAALNVADPTSFGPPQGTRAAGSVDCGRGATEHAAGAAADLGEHRMP